MVEDDQETLLAALNAHGRDFMKRFGPYDWNSEAKKDSQRTSEEDEWQGIQHSSALSLSCNWSGLMAVDDESDEDGGDDSSSSPGANVVTFTSRSDAGELERPSRAARRAFMV